MPHIELGALPTPALGCVLEQSLGKNLGEVHGKQPWGLFSAVSIALSAISWSAVSI